jgi:hypothetical protein
VEDTVAVAQAAAAVAATPTGTTAEAVDTARPPTTITRANMLRTGMRYYPQGTGISSTVTGSPFICFFLFLTHPILRAGGVQQVWEIITSSTSTLK